MNRLPILAISAHLAQHMDISEPGRYLISITEPGEVLIKFSQGWEAILPLQFDDIDRPTAPIKIVGQDVDRNLILFHKAQAINILDFIEEAKDMTMLVIHCHAGISRSVGVKVALEKIISDRDVYNQYPLHNKYVSRLLLEEDYKRNFI